MIAPLNQGNLGRLPGSAQPLITRLLFTQSKIGEDVIDVTVLLRSGTSTALTRHVSAAPEADFLPITRFARQFDLQVIRYSNRGCSVELRGSVRDFEAAFGIRLAACETPSGRFRTYRGELLLPQNLLSSVEGVFGLANVPISKSFEALEGRASRQALSLVKQLSERYDFPPKLSGKGELIGILTFGGAISESDWKRYCEYTLGTPRPIRFENVAVAPRLNQNSRYDKEVALDLQVASGLAPGARIVSYCATNDEKGWVDALTRAIHEDPDRPSVLTLSWGAFERWWTAAAISAISRLLEDAAQLGITVCAASGDDGCAKDIEGNCQVTFPASSPFVLACGGTSTDSTGREVVWNARNQCASGGGISDRVPRPAWQPRARFRSPVPSRRNPNFDGRQLPDVSAPAGFCFHVYAGGSYQNGLGGTSAAAPFWSALVARLNEGLKQRGRSPLGHFLPRLYQNRSVQETFTDITNGQNDPFGTGGYEAQPGWDACTGWGSPNGERLLDRLLSLPSPI